jgi:hypothetical protein
MNLLISVSQWERKVIGERTHDAMQHLKATGQVYSRPVCTDRALIAWMQEQRLHGKSYHAIASTLIAGGTTTTRGVSGPRCPCGGSSNVSHLRHQSMRYLPCIQGNGRIQNGGYHSVPDHPRNVYGDGYSDGGGTLFGRWAAESCRTVRS